MNGLNVVTHVGRNDWVRDTEAASSETYHKLDKSLAASTSHFKIGGTPFTMDPRT
jgi:hypothetical protein